MKKRLIIIIITIINFFCLYTVAQNSNCYGGEVVKRTVRLTNPTLVNLNIFKHDLQKETFLKEIIESLKTEKIIGHYMYSFSVQSNGKVLPLLYYEKGNARYGKITKFIQKKFNKYKWVPATIVGCSLCKRAVPLQLTIRFNDFTKSANITVKSIANFSTRPFIEFTICYPDPPSGRSL